MDSIREQMDLTNEISDAISNPVGMGNMVDEVGIILSCTLAHLYLGLALVTRKWWFHLYL